MVQVNHLSYYRVNSQEGAKELNKLLIQGWTLKTSCVSVSDEIHHFLTKNFDFVENRKVESVTSDSRYTK